MKKVSIAVAGVGLTLCGASPVLAASLPRLTQGPADYVLMPLLGYLGLVVVPHALRLLWSLGRSARQRA